MSNDNVFEFPYRKQEIIEDKNKEVFGKKTPIYNIIDVRWFSNNRVHVDVKDPIGIVLVEDDQTKVFAVIGNGTDPQEIAAWGSHITREMAEGIFEYQMPDYKEYN